MTLFPFLVFLAVTMALAGLVIWFTPTRTEERVRALAPQDDKSAWTETMVRLAAPFAQLSSPRAEGEANPLRLRFLQAGIRQPDAPLIYFGLKTLLPLAFAALAYLTLRAMGTSSTLELLLKVLVAALAANYLPNLVLWLATRDRRREIFENFPDAADLMLVCVEAGMGLDAAITKVTDEIKLKSTALAEELHWTNLEMRAGATREKSLRNLALRTGVEETGTFATMLTQADRYGTSIGDSLRVFSDDLRHKPQTGAEEQAAKIPTKMLIPLVLCIFPVVSLVILSPAGIRVIRQMMPMLSGGG